MNEKNRQFMIFGDFGGVVEKDIASELVDLKKKYDFQDGVAPDVNAVVPGVTASAVMRQAFFSQDRNVVVVFGEKSIYMQSNLSNLSSYDESADKGLDILKSAISVFDLKVNRIACNGSVIGFEVDDPKEIYPKLFNADSFIYDDTSPEWDFSTNRQVFVDKLGCTVNQIVRFIRAGDIVGSDGTMGGPLVMVYDCNTSPMADKIFDENEVDMFFEHAKEFRRKAVELCSRK